jgi:hypothetical protein
MVKQTVVVLNSDETLHNIHGLPRNNAEFNFGQPRVKMEKEMTFTKEEIFRVKCDVHPWMSAWVGVFEHPFHNVTDSKGTFEIKDLPAGKYVVAAWHEKFGEVTQDLEIADGDEKDISFTLSSKD